MKIEVKKIMEHYEIRIDGNFWCTCDSMNEVDSEIEYIKAVWWRKGDVEIQVVK